VGEEREKKEGGKKGGCGAEQNNQKGTEERGKLTVKKREQRILKKGKFTQASGEKIEKSKSEWETRDKLKAE